MSDTTKRASTRQVHGRLGYAADRFPDLRRCRSCRHQYKFAQIGAPGELAYRQGGRLGGGCDQFRRTAANTAAKSNGTGSIRALASLPWSAPLSPIS